MEWMNQIWTQVAQYINVPYFLIFTLFAYSGNKYLGKVLQRITKFNWLPVYTVLILATITAVPFLIWTEAEWVKIVFSYALGVTLHELVFKFLGQLFKKK